MSLLVFGCTNKLSRTPGDGHTQNGTYLNLTVPPKALSLSRPCGSISPNSDTPTCFSHTPTCTVSAAAFPPTCTCTSTFNPASNNITTESTTDSETPTCATATIKPEPILIPPPTLQARDTNRVPTPLSGRADRKGNLFPFSRSPSPEDSVPRSFGKPWTFSAASSDSESFFGRLEPVWSASLCSSTSARSHHGNLKMPDRTVALGHYPTSPLSPKSSAWQGLSPQNSQRRGNHGRQASRNMHLNLGRFHPSNFSQADASSVRGPPQITYTRTPPSGQIESPRLLREKHREFLQQAQLSSKLAASPLSAKPDAPRLDPLGSPKGPVTPLALEEAGDYFSTASAGKISPAASPGTRSPRAASVSSNDDTKPSKSRKIATS